ncbi:hypothetical protein FDF74_10350 [Clostridium niameyense]|uniref:L,D-TPase catalytic domain-containing protein n=1 Tax=Clostridium niameyense TaxID=1622073 RepID=A0A6M0RBB5_9CLOT|nr:L,D-transpeptidase family protein [Clostridium niameyense]NEZ47591.1 hypothetical protein [Clostridium niameyense]
MSKFKKILFILIFILAIEIVLIYIGYKKDINTKNNSSNNKNIAIFIDLTSNRLDVFKNSIIVKSYNIASGKVSTPSPIGTWKIINKGTWGSGFGGRWMGLNVPWGTYGIHGTNRPNSIGHRASHGCIRMNNKDVIELYDIIPYGTTVIIWGGPFGNFGEYLRPIRPGMTGSDVYEVQRLLKQKGYYNGNPDGIYGENMRMIVHKFQKDNNLYICDTINSSFYKQLGVQLIE